LNEMTAKICLCLGLCAVLNGFTHSFPSKTIPSTREAKNRNLPFRKSRNDDFMVEGDDIYVMMNGLPGNMGKEVAAACIRKGFKIAPYSLTGSKTEQTEIDVDDQESGSTSFRVSLIKEGDPGADEAIEKMKREFGKSLICIDYTHPSAVSSNAEFYAKHKLNFVMGTTGGDRKRLKETTEKSGVYAVIAPNMGKQIVALQTAIEYMAREFPGSFEGYELSVTESHQSTKADTSGTAKALSKDFSALIGTKFDTENDIKMIRDEEGQKVE